MSTIFEAEKILQNANRKPMGPSNGPQTVPISGNHK